MKISFGNQDFILHPDGALLWPARRMLIVADLHLEKGSHYAQRGYFLPPYDSRETLSRLLNLYETTGSRAIMVLGDGFHDEKGFDRLPEEEKELFRKLCRCGLIWIKGNHDRNFIPFALTALDMYSDGNLTFTHEATAAGNFEVSGHFHPKINITHKGGFVSTRCFIHDERKLIIPAFGAYTGGLSIDSDAIKSLFPGDFRCYALNAGKIYSLPALSNTALKPYG